MSKKLRIGLVGLGFIGEVHARTIAENPQAELAGVSDLNTELRDRFSKQYGCKAYGSYEEMLADPTIDAVDLCVQEDYHLNLAVAAANAKKNIFIEKPLAKTLEESLAIRKAVEENGVRMMVAHVCKFDPRYAQLKTAIRNGELGEITSMYFKRGNPVATANRLKGTVSFFYYLGIHDLEMLVDYNLPAKPTRVYAQASSKVNKHMNDLDTAFVIINFDNGVVANFQVGWAYPSNSAMGILCQVEVIGTKGAGSILIDNQGLQIMKEDSLAYPDTLHWPEYNGKVQGDMKAQIEHYVEATLSGEEYLVDNVSCTYAVAIAEAAQKSIKEGKPIDLSL